MDFKILPFELKSADGDGSTFAGYANAFHNIDSAQEIVVPGAFKDTIADFLCDGVIGGLNHNWDLPIGKPTSAREDGKGLFVEGKISNTQHGQDCKILMKDGVIKKLSIGYRVLGDQYLENADQVTAYWKDAGYKPTAQDIASSKNGARLLTKLHLYEFSPVTVPANSMADITRVKRFDADSIETERDFERFLRDAGFSRKQSVKITVSGFKALTTQRDADEDTPDEQETTTDKTQEASEEIAPIEAAVESLPLPDSEPEPVGITETVVQKTATVAQTLELASTLQCVDQSELRALYASLQSQQAQYLRR